MVLKWSGRALPERSLLGSPLRARSRRDDARVQPLKPPPHVIIASAPLTCHLPEASHPHTSIHAFSLEYISYSANPNYDTSITMSCKRKRSVDESPVSACSFGSFATPEAQSPTPIASGYAMDMEAPMSRGMGWDFSNLGRVKSGDWIQRTRKRVRDNRPDEHVVHGMYCRHRLYVSYSDAAQRRL